MTVVVFCGPTISHTDAAEVLEASYRPPASQGDVTRAALERPEAIGIVDGYFHQVPSVWHKEILWALDQGIAVYGSASMGALRAAELAPFGMRGVGRIFRDFADGRLEDDDEVAVVHGPAETEYRALAEPLVNIRATLAAAEEAGVIGGSTHARLVDVAKELDYKERSFARVLEWARLDGFAGTELDALGEWLPQGRVDQKRADAIAMLETMRDELDRPAERRRAQFVFERTALWERAAAAARAATTQSAREPSLLSLVAWELLLSGGFAGPAQRALEKQRLLAVHGLEQPTLDDVGLSLEELVEWQVKRVVSSGHDGDKLADAAAHDPDGFATALLREFAYVRLLDGGGAP